MLSVLVWWLTISLFGEAAAPLAARVFPRFPDRGLAFTKPLGLLLFSYASWLATTAGLRHDWAMTLAALAMIGLRYRWRATAVAPSGERRRAEAVFAVAFLFFCAVRALSPDIWGAEKYMDFAFFNANLRTRFFPPEDPWLSGAAANYYYFGYLVFADVARLTAVAPEIAYNLALATIAGFTVSAAVSIARAGGAGFGGALLGGAALALLGNLDAALQILVERKGLGGFDWWRSSRVVPNTINEFPFFSFLHGDLHPHVVALAIDLPLVGVVAAAWQEARAAGRRALVEPVRMVVAALLLGMLALTNPWDLPVYFLLAGVIGLNRVWDLERPLTSAAPIALGLGALAGAAVLSSLPFTVHFHAPFQGFGRVHAHTALGPFLVVFGFLLAPPAGFLVERAIAAFGGAEETRDLVFAAGGFGYVALYVATGNAVAILTAILIVSALAEILGVQRDGDLALPLVFLAVASVALFACEIVFLRDAYGAELHRMNTVFKLYFQAWLFLALALPLFAARALEPLTAPAVRRGAVALLVAGAAVCLVYPAAALTLRWRASPGLSLDGLRYLERDHPGDAAAILWLRDQAEDRPVVLEATGDAYSYYARVSANTGFPTVLGWGNHEGVWRGADARIAARAADVQTLYETTDLGLARSLLARYRVRFVFVGELERERAPAAGLAKFDEHPDLFTRVFTSGGTSVYRVRG